MRQEISEKLRQIEELCSEIDDCKQWELAQSLFDKITDIVDEMPDTVKVHILKAIALHFVAHKEYVKSELQ